MFSHEFRVSNLYAGEVHKAVVDTSGRVTWVTTFWMSTFCSIDLDAVPDDSQECILKFGSWAYHGQQACQVKTATKGSNELFAYTRGVIMLPFGLTGRSDAAI